MNAVYLPPICFLIAKRYGISPKRLCVADSLDALRLAAWTHGISKAEAAAYGPKTHAVCIQADDVPGGEDVWIVLRLPLDPEAMSDTRARLKEHHCADTDRMLPESDDERLICFLLLHEIGHHQLKHDGGGDKPQKEKEADLWAVERLKEYFVAV